MLGVGVMSDWGEIRLAGMETENGMNGKRETLELRRDEKEQ